MDQTLYVRHLPGDNGLESSVQYNFGRITNHKQYILSLSWFHDVALGLLKRGKLLFNVGALLFFPGIASLGILTVSEDKSDIAATGFVVSGLLVLIGLPMLLLAGAVLFKNRRTV